MAVEFKAITDIAGEIISPITFVETGGGTLGIEEKPTPLVVALIPAIMVGCKIDEVSKHIEDKMADADASDS